MLHPNPALHRSRHGPARRRQLRRWHFAANGGKHAWSYGLYIWTDGQTLPSLTINYGLRYDQFRRHCCRRPAQSPPQCGVDAAHRHHHAPCWLFALFLAATHRTVLASGDVALFDNTTAASASDVDTTPSRRTRADLYDFGVGAESDSKAPSGHRPFLQTVAQSDR